MKRKKKEGATGGARRYKRERGKETGLFFWCGHFNGADLPFDWGTKGDLCKVFHVRSAHEGGPARPFLTSKGNGRKGGKKVIGRLPAIGEKEG